MAESTTYSTLLFSFAGAGISVASGIPDFRSKQEIPGVPELAKMKLKDMFHHSMIMASVTAGNVK